MTTAARRPGLGRLGQLAALAVVGALLGAGCGPVGEAERGALPALPGGGASARDTAATGRAAAEGGGDAAAAPLVAPAGNVEVRVEGDLPTLTGKAPAYRFTGTADRRRAERLARALGLTAPVVEGDQAWTVNDGDLELSVGRDSPNFWSLFSRGADCVVAGTADEPAEGKGIGGEGGAGVGCATSSISVSPQPDVAPDRRPATPPRTPDPASRATAERRAREVFAAAGVGFEAGDIEVSEADGGWRTQAAVRLAGRDVVGLEQSLVVAPDGSVRFGNGVLGDPERLGDYPLAGTTAGLRRLQDVWSGHVPARGRPEPAPLSSEPKPAEEPRPAAPPPGVSSPPSPPHGDPGPQGGGSSEPFPGSAGERPVPDTVPPRLFEPTVLTVTGVDLVLELRHPGCPGQAAHLVPAYRFRFADGGVATVAAVEDRYLEQHAASDAGGPASRCAPVPDRGEPAVVPEPRGGLSEPGSSAGG